MIDGTKLIIIDEFLLEPEKLRQYAKDISTRVPRTAVGVGYELHPNIEEFDLQFPAFQRELALFINNQLGDNVRTAFGLGHDHSNIGVWKGPLFNCVYKLPANTPHVDRGHVSSFIYLNPPEQCNGGTGIYRHKPSNRLRIVQNFCSLEHISTIPLDRPLTHSTEEWELMHKVEMRFNRMVAFNASVIHKVFFEPEEHNFSEQIRD